MQQLKEKIFKVILCGGQGVGKTSIITRYIEGQYKQDYFSTIGIDFKLHNMTIGSTKLKLQIWDTAGQQRFQSLTSIHFKGASGCICVVDLTSRESLKNCRHYLNEGIKLYGMNKNCVFLVGNKVDNEGKREVQKEDLESLANEFEISYLLCSAKDGTNVNKLFEDMGRKLIEEAQEQNVAYNTIHPTISFEREKKCNC